MESRLKKDCQTLLKQLQRSQLLLNREVATRLDGTGSQDLEDTDNEKYLLKSVYARNKLLSAAKSAQDGYIANKAADVNNKLYTVSNKENIYRKNKDIMQLESEEQQVSSKLPPCDTSAEPRSWLQTIQSDNCDKKVCLQDDKDVVTSSSWQPASPDTQRRRNLIDRHIHVPTRLDAQELTNLNKERMLNYSYSHISPDGDVSVLDDPELAFQKSPITKPCQDLEDPTKISPKMNRKSVKKVTLINNTDKLNDDGKSESNRTQLNLSDVHKGNTRDVFQIFKQQLQDEGNSRKLNSFIRDTTIKPKSLLNCTYYSLHNLSNSKRNNSGVRSDTTINSQSSWPDQRLLGYDWIAALLDNDSDLVDQSESFFNELREFRKAYKDECSNQFYMEGPHTLVDLEPEPVVETVKEPKVEQYFVNERLFTEPIHPGLVGYGEEDLEFSDRGSKREPTDDNPRFVCVSIPRSTLRSPYRARPHRRGSFDASDSCSLIDHCLLGSQSVIPTMIPTAKSLDLKTEVGTGFDLKKTTMAEAEKLALMSGSADWPFYKPTPRLELIPLWQKKYSDLAKKMASLPAAASISSSSSRDSESVKRATDKLLNSAYSTMYEMERLKEQRKLENKIKKMET